MNLPWKGYGPALKEDYNFCAYEKWEREREQHDKTMTALETKVEILKEEGRKWILVIFRKDMANPGAGYGCFRG